VNNDKYYDLFKQALDLYKVRNYDDSLEILDSLEEIYSDNCDVIFQKALCYAAKRRFMEAKECCGQIKESFDDNRVSELEEWMQLQLEPQDIETPARGLPVEEENPNQFNTEKKSNNEVLDELRKPPDYVIPQRIEKKTVKCRKCGQVNSEQNFRCSRCGEFMHTLVQANPGVPGTGPAIKVQYKGKANIAFITAILGWICAFLIIIISIVSGDPGQEMSEALALGVFFLFSLSGIFCLISIITGAMSMSGRNIVNRWKAILGFVMGMVGCGLILLFIFLMILIVIISAEGMF
jgi:hypothetical protein